MVLSINKANDPTKRYKEVFISLGGVLSKYIELRFRRKSIMPIQQKKLKDKKQHAKDLVEIYKRDCCCGAGISYNNLFNY